MAKWVCLVGVIICLIRQVASYANLIFISSMLLADEGTLKRNYAGVGPHVYSDIRDDVPKPCEYEVSNSTPLTTLSSEWFHLPHITISLLNSIGCFVKSIPSIPLHLL